MPQIAVSEVATVEGAKGEYLKLTLADGKYYNVFGDLMANVDGPGTYAVTFTQKVTAKGKYTNVAEIKKVSNVVQNAAVARNGQHATQDNAGMYISSCVNAAAEITKAVIDKGIEKDTQRIVAVAGATLMQLLQNIRLFLHAPAEAAKPKPQPKKEKVEESYAEESEAVEEEVSF